MATPEIFAKVYRQVLQDEAAIRSYFRSKGWADYQITRAMIISHAEAVAECHAEMHAAALR